MKIEMFDVVTVPLRKGVNLIEASAGTGKTFSIAALFLRFVLEEGIPISRIVAVTYTVAATQELKDRIRKRLREALASLREVAAGNDAVALEKDPILKRYLDGANVLSTGLNRLELAVQSFDEAQIFTIHGFCQRSLQDYAFDSGVRYEAETLEDPAELYDEVVRDYWRKTFYNAPPFLVSLALYQPEAIGCDAWKQLLSATRNHPDVTVFPEAGGSAEELARQLQADYSRLQSLWNTDREGIVAASTDPDRLKGAFIRGINEQLPSLNELAAETPGHTLLDALHSFTFDSMAGGTRAKRETPAHPFFEACTTFLARLEAYYAAVNHEFLAYAEAELAQRKEARNLLTFDDLLTRLYHGLQGGNGKALRQSLAGRYDVALIDEFQDTDPVQAAIFNALFAAGQHWLYLIGDPKQAIYSFRGADIYAYLKAADRAQYRYTLSKNWRSSSLLLDGFNAFFGRNPKPFLNERIQYHPVTAPDEKERTGPPPLEFRYFEAEKALSKAAATKLVMTALVADIRHLCSGAAVTPPPRLSQIAVLVRNRYQADDVQNALRNAGIHSVLYTERSVFDSEEAVSLLQLLEGVANYRNDGAVRKALITPFIGYDATALAELNTDEAKRERLLEQFMAWHTLWHEKGFTSMLRAIMTELEIRQRIVQRVGGERQLTNLLHLAELLHQEESQRKLTPDSLCSWLAQQLNESGGEASQLRLESDEDAVSIITIHKSKGLEYAYVFCPQLWNYGDNSKRKGFRFHLDEERAAFDMRAPKEAPAEHQARHQQEQLEEELRLLYVAVTRAKYRCTIYLGNFKDGDLSPLGYLLGGMSRECVETLCKEFPESIILRTIDPAVPASSGCEADAAPVLTAKPFTGNLAQVPFLTSFTSLVRGSLRSGHTEVLDPEESDEAGLETAPLSEPAPEAEPFGISAFEKGARAGDFFHEVLEELDFTQPEMVAPLVAQKLQEYGFGAHPLTPALEAAIHELLEVELTPGLKLSGIRQEQRLSEAGFSAHLPRFTVEQLRAIYRHYTGPLDLSGLTFPMIQGFLQGTMDLLFEHEGKYYLLDWKSNWLGHRPCDYELPNVEAQMKAHYYTLQAHLYLFALDRFLSQRLRGYDYETHFGGIFYLFIRGVDRNHPERGIYREKPPLALIRAYRAL